MNRFKLWLIASVISLFSLGCGGVGGSSGGDTVASLEETDVPNPSTEETDVPNPAVTVTRQAADKVVRVVIASLRENRLQSRLEDLDFRVDNAEENPGPDEEEPELEDNPFDRFGLIRHGLIRQGSFLRKSVAPTVAETFQEVEIDEEGNTITSTFTETETGFIVVEETRDSEGVLLESVTTTVTENADGSSIEFEIEKDEDGKITLQTTTTFFADGSLLSISSGPDEVEQLSLKADGSGTYTETDLLENSVTEGIINADGSGSFTTTFPDGTVETGQFSVDGSFSYTIVSTEGTTQGSIQPDGMGSSTTTLSDGTIIQETYTPNGETSVTTEPNGNTIRTNLDEQGNYSEVLQFVEGDIVEIRIDGQYLESETFNETIEQTVRETFREEVIFRDGTTEVTTGDITTTDEGESSSVTFSDGSSETSTTTFDDEQSVERGTWHNADNTQTSEFTWTVFEDETSQWQETFTSGQETVQIQLSLDEEGVGQGTVTSGGTEFTLILPESGEHTLLNAAGEEVQ